MAAMKPWAIIQFLGIQRNMVGLRMGIVAKNVGMDTATVLRVDNSVDLDCLELFPPGTILLAQIDGGKMLDWTLAPRKGPGPIPPDCLPGDEWKYQ
jgi:hypothetical protein